MPSFDIRAERDVANVPDAPRITDHQMEVLLDNIKHYYDPRCADPHQMLAEALGESRNEAKRILYMYMYTADALMPKLYNEGARREVFYLQRLNLTRAQRADMIERANEYAETLTRARGRGTNFIGLYQ